MLDPANASVSAATNRKRLQESKDTQKNPLSRVSLQSG